MKICAACQTDLPKDSYSKKQWKLDQRRCKVCIANNQEVQPTPTKQKDNDQNTNEIVKTLDSMYLEDVERKISDEEIFKQPPAEDCPICFLRMPSFVGKHTAYRYQTCCGKVICNGCIYAIKRRDCDVKCPFCRVPTHTSEKEANERDKALVEAGDPLAIYNHGCDYENGANGFEQDHVKSLELFQRAGELGYAAAFCMIGYAYQFGRGVEVDKMKALYFYELGAMKGCAYSRYNLGDNELRKGNMNRALKHYMIAVRSGHVNSLEAIKKSYSKGHATKEEYTKALRAYQEYLGEIKSPQRDEAAVFSNELYRYY